MVASRSLAVAFVFLIIAPLLCAQSTPRVKPFVHNVRLVIGPIDEFSRAFGLRDEDVARSAGESVRNSGWNVTESSDLMISVHIRSGGQREEDKSLFTIEVHGGSVPVDSTRGEYPLTIPDIPGVRTIEVSWNDNARILSVTRQLVKKVANSLIKADIDKQHNHIR